jgi:hypothetical protein
MSTSRIKTSSVLQGFPKSRSVLAGYPPVMATPTATDGGTGTTVSVAFTAVSGATSYTVLSTPGSLTGTGASSPITVSGLTTNTAYTFQVSATNSAGTGPYSAASNSVTPVTPGAFETINSTVLSSTQTSVSFTSIPQTYTNLEIRIFGKSADTGSTGDTIKLGFNGNNSTLLYSQNGLQTGTTTLSTQVDTSALNIRYALVTNAVGSNYFGSTVININNYTSTKYKPMTWYGSSFYGTTNAGQYLTFGGGHNGNNNAISSIQFTTVSGFGFAAGTTIALYGIKA